MDKSLKIPDELKDYFETICNVFPVGLFRTDDKGNIIYVNKQFESMTGKKIDELKMDGWIKCIYTRDLQMVITEWKRCIKNKEKFTLEFRVKNDKDSLWVLIQATPLLNGDGFVGTLTNINKRKTILNELMQIKGRC
jgi:PAS domain S-box-containing protein